MQAQIGQFRDNKATSSFVIQLKVFVNRYDCQDQVNDAGQKNAEQKYVKGLGHSMNRISMVSDSGKISFTCNHHGEN